MSPFKSIKGRSLGKLLEGYKSSDIGKGFGSGVSSEASGGAIVTVGDYTYHIFSTNGAFETTTESFNKTINYVVVGGGGGAGSGLTGNNANHYGAGGGGAGGVRIGTALVSGLNVYNITVGEGGAGNNTTYSGPTPGFGSRGIDTTFGLSSPIVGSGGGGGENRNSRVNGGKSNSNADSYMPGGSGGGGGGGSDPVGSSIASPDGISPTTQGYNGGSGDGPGQSGGGGGGAGQVGQNAPDSNNGGPGGGGTTTVFSGPVIQPALPTGYQVTLGTSWRDALGPTGLVGGGGGGSQGSANFVSNGTGGPGGGGPGCPNNDGAGEHGISGTGGGGGGGAAQNTSGPRNGGNGGRGIVMIRYPKS